MRPVTISPSKMRSFFGGIRDRIFASNGGGAVEDHPSFLLDFLNGRRTISGVRVDPQRALTLAAYYACVRNISEDIGKLPIKIMRQKADGDREVVLNHTARTILQKVPNPDMVPNTFKAVVTSWAVSWGNGYAEIIRNARGQAMGMLPVHPGRVRLKRNLDTNEIEYQIWPGFQFCGIIAQPIGEMQIIPQNDMFHIMGMSGDGLCGISVAEFGAESFGVGLAAQNFEGAFFGNNTHIGGVLEHPIALKKEAREHLTQSWREAHQGSDKAFKTAILEEGMKFVPTAIPPKDAQFVQSKQMKVAEIARWFRMPPHKIQDLTRSTNNNIEAQNIEYVDTLMPWIVKWEEEISRKLIIEDDIVAKFSVQALLRGDVKSRAEFYRTLFGMGAISINEIRRFEDMNRIEENGGDSHFLQLNLTTVDRVAAGTPQAMGETSRFAKLAEVGKNRMGRALESMKPVIAASMKQVLSKEVNATKRVMAKGMGEAELKAWADEFYNKQVVWMQNLLEPVISSICVMLTVPSDETVKIVSGLFQHFTDFQEDRKDWFLTGEYVEIKELEAADSLLKFTNTTYQDAIT